MALLLLFIDCIVHDICACTESIPTQYHGKAVETDADRNQRSPADVVDTVMILRRTDTTAVHHGRGSIAEAGTRQFT